MVLLLGAGVSGVPVLALTKRSPWLGGLCLTTMGKNGVWSSVVILLMAE